MICPDQQQLKRFLTGQLSTPESEALAAHGEECARCLEMLAQLAEDVGAAAQLPRLRQDAEQEAEPSREFLEHLQRTLPRPPWLGSGTGAVSSFSASDETPALPHIHGYEILSALGRGGMGVVYLARQISLNRLVALKMVLAGSHASAHDRARFHTEAEATARLQHPNIVQIHEIGEQDGQSFFTMELVRGPTLAEAIAGRPQPALTAARLVETLAQAVQAAHEQGILHRDLKPANVLLQFQISDFIFQISEAKPDDTKSEIPNLKSAIPKITDFGLARRLDDVRQTQKGVVMGTPSYMAPEQASPKAAPPGPAVDIYALGTILFELLTGRPPFLGESWESTVAAVLHDEPIPPRKLEPKCPRDLETICLKCLEKVPGQRYRGAADLAEDLRRFQAGEPIRARPPSTLDRWVKFARRNKALVGGASTTLGALILGTIVASLFAIGETRQRKLADENARQAETARQKALSDGYQARIAAASLALGDLDLLGVRQHLDAAPKSLRGWEWQYLHERLLDRSPAIVHIPKEYGIIYALWPRARRVITYNGRLDQHFRLVDIQTGAALQELPQGANGYLAQTKDGPLLVIHRPGEPLFLVNERAEVRRTSSSFDEKCGLMAVNAEGTCLAASVGAAVADDHLELRDLPSGKLRQRIPGVGALCALTFSSDGKLLAAACNDQTVRVWDLAASSAPLTLRGHSAVVHGVAFRPDGQCLLSWGADKTLRQWHLPSGRPLDVCRGHYQRVIVAAYSADGQWIVSGSEDRTVRLWRSSGGEAIAILRGHTLEVLRVAFAEDGSSVISAGPDGTVRFWSLWPYFDSHVLHGHTNYVYPVAFSPDGQWLASGSWDNTIRLWDALSGEPIATLQGCKGFVAALAVSPDGNSLVSRSNDGRLRIWDVATGAIRVELDEGMRVDGLPHSIAISPDGSQVAWGMESRIRFLDLRTGEELPSIALPVSGIIRLVSFSPDGRRLAIAATEPLFNVMDLETHSLVQPSYSGFDAPKGLLRGLTFSPDGKRLLSVGDDHIVRLWNAETGDLQQALQGHTDQVFAAVFHPKGARMATAGRDRVIRIWDTATGEEMARLPGHSEYVFSLAFSSDGTTLASGSGDYTVRLWDTVPLAKRIEARKELHALRPEAERLVEQLFQEEGTAAKVMRRVRADTSLSQPLQRAAWHAVLRSVRKK